MKSILIFLLLGSTVLLNAQDLKQEESSNSTGKSWSVMFPFSNLQGLFAGDYYATPQAKNYAELRLGRLQKIQLRIGFGLQLNKYNNETTSPYDGIDDGSRWSKNESNNGAYYFVPGIATSLHSKGKLETYGFISIPMRFSWGGYSKSEQWITGKQDGMDYELVMRSEYDDPGSFKIGVKPGLGFNYFFSNRIAIGAEIGLAYEYSSTNGNRRVYNFEELKLDGVSTALREMDNLYELQSSSQQLSLDGGAQFHIVVSFGKR